MRPLAMLGAPVTILALVALAAVSTACGGGGGGDDEKVDAFPVAGNSELVVGPNRFAAAIIDADANAPILTAPGTSAHFRFLQDDEVKIDVDATFVWAIPDANGFWTADVDFDRAGPWSVEIDVVRDGKNLSVTGASFNVLAQSNYVNIGDEAPATENPTLETEPNIKKISSDSDPDLALYRMTVAQALEDGEPFVVVFATPAFCQTRFCGPVLENVKSVLPRYEGQVNFIHIEPYQLSDEGTLVQSASGGPQPVPAMGEWRLRSEPWVFVVGADGRVSKRFEGAASVDELRAAIDEVLG